ncbi:MAG: hypothetical protein ACOWWO_06210 [Peptococcaceae bacterium]
MPGKQLNCGGVDFLPSIHGYQLPNYSVSLDKTQLNKVKKAAFRHYFVPDFIADKILLKTLASGVCSGISAYTLLQFTGKNFCAESAEFAIAVLQARTWGSLFLKACIKTYYSPVFKNIAKLECSLEQGNGMLLVILPKFPYLTNIVFAHTIIPYAVFQGLFSISIRVYDSNYPRDDTRVLTMNKDSYSWFYDGRSSDKWVLTVNKIENLTQKVSFLL